MLSTEQLVEISEDYEQMDMDALWLNFSQPLEYGRFHHNLETFKERREGFLWAVKHLLENGYVRLEHWSDDSIVTGTPAEQVDLIRETFPRDDDGMNDGGWFFPPGCPVGVIWEWSGRDPKPFIDAGRESI